MLRPAYWAICVFIAILAAGSAASTATAVTTTLVASGLNQPIFVASPPGDHNRLFIVERAGLVKILNRTSGTLNAAPFLDVTTRVTVGSEQGLFSLAFHPDYAHNGFVYIHYIDRHGDSQIARFTASSDPDVADPNSYQSVIWINQPHSQHNGGWIGFGPDGYLYLSFGDGGPQCDPNGRAQSIIGELLGNILRIDVNGDDFPSDAVRNYAIPPTNPFVNRDGEDEIWSYGLRNPWRCSFDRLTGDFYIGDVGHKLEEELDFQPASSHGGENWGWMCKEGTQCSSLSPSSCTPVNCACGDASTLPPIHEYTHAGGRCSISGGYVYRGTRIPGLSGTYFFADYCSGQIWSFRYAPPSSSGPGGISEFTDRTAELAPGGGNTINSIVSFGEDADGELYIVEMGNTANIGEIWQIVPAAAGNQPPQVSAGSPQTITLPASALLNGTASDDGLPSNTLTHTWSKLSGPGTVAFANDSALATTATFSVTGQYVLRLTASDSALSSSSDVTITVNSSSPTGQRVASLTLMNADTDQPMPGYDPFINGATLNLAALPTSHFNIRANTDPSLVGSVRFAYDTNANFRTESGAPYAFAGDNGAGDYASWTPALGSHTVKATPYTGSGASGTIGTALTVNFTVTNGATTNLPPFVNAGSPQTITLPTSASLSGTDSDDGQPSGTLTQTWSKFSGPGTVTFGNASALSTTASFSTSGQYVLRLTASDGALSSSSDVTIIVNPSGTTTQRVVSLTLMNADLDQPVPGYDPCPEGATLNMTTLPTTRLNFRANTDPYPVGSIRFAYDSNSNFRTETTPPYAFAGDTGGDYAAWTPTIGAHTIRATPYTGASASGTAGTALTLSLTVSGSSGGSNQPPVVNAGPAQTVILPNPANLTGTVSDDGQPFGTLSSLWSKLGGPGDATFGNAASPATTASFTVAGQYVLRLTASDGALSSSSDVIITVNGAPQRVLSLTLINADTDQPIAGYDPLIDGSILDLALLLTRHLNVRANTDPTLVGSVKFGLDANASYRIESGAPYSLAGDTNGDYSAWTPAIGPHAITVTPFTQSGAKGTAGIALTINFTVR